MFNKLCKQFNGVTMGSSVGPALGNIFISSFENKWLKDCPHGLNDDIEKEKENGLF